MIQYHWPFPLHLVIMFLVFALDYVASVLGIGVGNDIQLLGFEHRRF